MFNNIPNKIERRLKYLESLDNEIRSGKVNERGLWQISRDSGKFLSLIVSLAPKGNYIEIGTSGGYSGLWICLACMEKNIRFTTFEVNQTSYERAVETFKTADVRDIVNPVHGDAKDYIEKINEISFCYLDGGDYELFFDLVVPKLIKGGILVADNMIIPKDAHAGFLNKALTETCLDSVIVSVGTGMLLARKI